jgi:hypothetical protein
VLVSLRYATAIQAVASLCCSGQAFGQISNGVSGPERYARLDCASVFVIDCVDPLKQHSVGFKLHNTCLLPLRFQYQAHHKKEDKTYTITDAIDRNKVVVHCAITANADHTFLTFEVPRGAPISPMDDVRKLLATIVVPNLPDPALSKQIAERAFGFDDIRDDLSRQGFTSKARDAFSTLKGLRNENAAASQNIPLRDAEYYVFGYYVGLADDPTLSFGIDYADVYMVVKSAAQKFDWSERWMRSIPDVPTSPPGGGEWAQAGLKDGRELRDHWINVLDAKGRVRAYPNQIDITPVPHRVLVP